VTGVVGGFVGACIGEGSAMRHGFFIAYLYQNNKAASYKLPN
jgi:hypothetical protein